MSGINQIIRDVRAYPLAHSATTARAVGVTLAVAATALGAFVRIPLPMTPVPVTLQTLFVLLSGAVLGRRLGGLSQGIYFLLGAAGLPLLAGGQGGVGYLATSATAGYLVGFMAAAWVVGHVSTMERLAPRARMPLAMAAGTVVIYLIGAAWFKLATGAGFASIWQQGVLPFLPLDVCKLALAAAAAGRLRHRFEEACKGPA